MHFLGRISLLALLLIAGTLAFGSAAYEVHEPYTTPGTQLVTVASNPTIPAMSFAVFDAETGQMLYEQDADAVRPIASITKLFAAAAIHDHFDLEDSTTLEWSDLVSHGTAGNLQFGQTYRYRELLMPLLLSSSNNAALTFERRSETAGFVLATQAEELAFSTGSRTIRLADASGLSPENVASARDLAQATTVLYGSHPYIFAVSGLSSYVGAYQGWQNNSPFITDKRFVGGKHGYTSAAGRTAVVLFNETIAGTDRTLGYVVLGSDDLVRDVDTLRTHVHHSVSWQ